MEEKTNWVYMGSAGLVTLGILYIGTLFPPVLTMFHVLVCIGLVLVVLLQSGRAADLAGAFGGAGSQTAFGPRGATTFLSKATTFLAVVFMVTSLTLALYASRESGSVLRDSPPAAEQTEEQSPGEDAAPEGAQPSDSAGEEEGAQEPAAETPDSTPDQ